MSSSTGQKPGDVDPTNSDWEFAEPRLNTDHSSKPCFKHSLLDAVCPILQARLTVDSRIHGEFRYAQEITRRWLIDALKIVTWIMQNTQSNACASFKRLFSRLGLRVALYTIYGMCDSRSQICKPNWAACGKDQFLFLWKRAHFAPLQYRNCRTCQFQI